jgi:hypothetical protein
MASPEERKIYKATLKQQRRWLKELVNVLHASSALNGGHALRPQRDDLPIKQLLHPRAIEAVEQRHGMLMIYRQELLSRGTKVTPENLAASLQIAVSTLYDRYRKDRIRRACGREYVETRGSRRRKVNTINFDEEFADKLADCRRW